jgi:glutathione S-transferase
VTLYDAPDCWKCVEVKQALDALGLDYRAVMVRGNPAARAALVAAQGEPPQVPMLVDGVLAVWDRRRILAYLDQTYGDAVPGAVPFDEMPVFVGGVCRVDDPGSC